jgi:hypothetical protein
LTPGNKPERSELNTLTCAPCPLTSSQPALISEAHERRAQADGQQAESTDLLEAYRPEEPILAKVFDEAARALRGLENCSRTHREQTGTFVPVASRHGYG